MIAHPKERGKRNEECRFADGIADFRINLFSGRATMTGETAGVKIDDATITTEANAPRVKDPDAQYLKIDVDTRQGNIVLAGSIFLFTGPGPKAKMQVLL